MEKTEFKNNENKFLLMFANFMEQQGITDTNNLNDTEKKYYLNKFLETSEVENFNNELKENSEYDNFAFLALIPFIPAIAGTLGLGSAGVGFLSSKKKLAAQKLAAEQERLRIEAEQKAAAKKQQTLIIGGGVALVTVIAVVLIFVFKR